MTTENWVLFLHRLLKTIPSGLSAEAYWILIPTMLVCARVLSLIPVRIHLAKPGFRTSLIREATSAVLCLPDLDEVGLKLDAQGLIPNGEGCYHHPLTQVPGDLAAVMVSTSAHVSADWSG